MRRVTTATALVLGVLLAGPAPAGAHGDEGVMELIEQEPAEDGGERRSVNYLVGLVYANDDDLVEGATVTAVATGPGGARTAPVTFTPAGPGRYQGTVTFPGPGRWTVVFSSADPVAEARTQEELAPPPPTTTTTTTTVTTTTTEATEVDSEPVDDGDDEGGSTGVVAAGVLGVLLLAVAGYALVTRRRAHPG